MMSCFGYAAAQQTPPQAVTLTSNNGSIPGQQAASSQVPLSNPELKKGNTAVNPFTGVSKAEEVETKQIEDLKKQKEVSTQKLQLKRDELESMRIDIEKQKLEAAVNPPAPPVVKEPPKKAEPPKKVVIYPDASKNESPVLVGIVEVGSQKVAMFEHEGRALRANVGSIVGGKRIDDISQTSVKWGGQHLNVSYKKGYPTVVLNDSEGPAERSSKKNTQFGVPFSGQSSAQAQSTPSAAQTYPGTNIPVASKSSSPQPFGLLPPPPPSK